MILEDALENLDVFKAHENGTLTKDFARLWQDKYQDPFEDYELLHNVKNKIRRLTLAINACFISAIICIVISAASQSHGKHMILLFLFIIAALIFLFRFSQLLNKVANLSEPVKKYTEAVRTYLKVFGQIPPNHIMLIELLLVGQAMKFLVAENEAKNARAHMNPHSIGQPVAFNKSQEAQTERERFNKFHQAAAAFGIVKKDWTPFFRAAESALWYPEI